MHLCTRQHLYIEAQRVSVDSPADFVYNDLKLFVLKIFIQILSEFKKFSYVSVRL